MKNPARARRGLLGLALVSLVFTPGCDTSSSPGAVPDAGDRGEVDARMPDAAVADGAAPDARRPDAQRPDAATPDARRPDAQRPDAATPDGGNPTTCSSPQELIDAFYADAGGAEQFAEPVRFAFESFLRGEAAFCRGDIDGAGAILDAVWDRLPVGSVAWSGLFGAGHGANLGAPVAYYGLRMLQDMVDHARSGLAPTARPVRLTVALPGCSQGIQPRSWEELNSGQGVEVRHALDPAILADDYALIRQSFEFFQGYVFAMSRGHLSLELEFASLPDVCVPVAASNDGFRLATILSPQPVWEALDPALSARTDWWMVVYPSHVPEQYPDFAGVEFISGGMGLQGNGGPVFLADDRWIIRKPPHLGTGPYTEAERRVYLPQWLQHEFYHHLYRLYPEHRLEVNGHDWFDRGTWPDDFVGVHEPDYYAESLHRRIWAGEPPLHARLRYAAPGPEVWAAVDRAAVAGAYRREPVQNAWHEGRIVADGDGFRWTNTAGVSWGLGDALAEGRLLAGPDNPYFNDADAHFYLSLERDADGEPAPRITGFRFLGELYVRSGD